MSRSRVHFSQASKWNSEQLTRWGRVVLVRETRVRLCLADGADSANSRNP